MIFSIFALVVVLGNGGGVVGVPTSSSTITSAPYLNTSISSSSASSVSQYSDCENAYYPGFSTNIPLLCECKAQLMSWLLVDRTSSITRTVTEIWDGVAVSTTFMTTITTVSNNVTYTTSELQYFTNVRTNNFNDMLAWPGSATPPCCSSCAIQAATVQMYYFPTPAISGAATSFVSNGQTFISPSVYIGFTSLWAMDYCSTVGNIYTSTTIAFDPSEITTVGSQIWANTTVTQVLDTALSIPSSWSWVTTTVTRTNLQFVNETNASQIDFRDLGQNCSSIAGYQYVAGKLMNYLANTYDPCHPTIILPDRVKSIDPAWADCADNLIGGFYDPPYALTQAAPLIAETTAPSPAAASTLAASTTTSATITVVAQSEVASSSSVDPTGLASSTSPSKVQSTASAAPAQTSTSSGLAIFVQTSTSTPLISIVLASTGTTSTTAAIIVGSQTIQPGSAITRSGTTISLATSGGAIFVDGQSTSISPTTTQAIIIGTQTLQPGSTVTNSGTTYYAAPTGGAVYINGVSTTIAPSTTPQAIIIGTQTILPGSSLTISGTTYSVPKTGSSIYINGIATALPSSVAEFILGTQTVKPGSAITVSGTTYSIASTGGGVIINGVVTTSPSLGAIIMSVFNAPTTSSGKASPTPVGGGGNGTRTGGLVQITGSGGTRERGFEVWWMGLVMSMWGLMVWL